jgi:tRNA pseudouridine32 synthase/23S rRNA pseudouridine746 synthase
VDEGRSQRPAGADALALSPLTGRTHQLRVHCAARDFPIHGDPIYGAGSRPDERLHLHARAIRIPLYKNKPAIEVEASAPEHMKAALAACGWTPQIDEIVIAARQDRESARLEAKADDL